MYCVLQDGLLFTKCKDCVFSPATGGETPLENDDYIVFTVGYFKCEPKFYFSLFLGGHYG